MGADVVLGVASTVAALGTLVVRAVDGSVALAELAVDEDLVGLVAPLLDGLLVGALSIAVLPLDALAVALMFSIRLRLVTTA